MTKGAGQEGFLTYVGEFRGEPPSGAEGSLAEVKDFALPVAVGLVAAGLGAASISSGLNAKAQEQQQATGQATPVLPACEVLNRAELVPEAGAWSV